MTKAKPRAIFTNDAECDDMNSLVHLLLYANEMDIEGIVLSSSIYHYAGDPERGVEPYRWAGGDWMWDYLDAYEEVWPNLVAHDPAYPTADVLRSVTCIGNVKAVGDMGEDTDGSELIRRAILADDPRPLWLLAGGGTNTICRALIRIEEDWRGDPRWDEVYARVCDKVRVYMIVTQDDTYRDYLAGTWPDVTMLHCTNIWGIAFLFNETLLPKDALPLMRGSWLKPHLLDKGPLLARYHTWCDGHVYPGEQEGSQFGSNPALAAGDWWGREPHEPFDMISEGDSPSFLHLVDRGLRQLEDPAYGGWGGRFARVEDNAFNPAARYWASAVDDDLGPCRGDALELSRWVADWMMELATRADWCVTGSYEDANHAPSLRVREGVDIVAHAGEELVLHAEGTDPDGDALTYGWWCYREAGTCPEAAEVMPDGSSCMVRVPASARPGETVHVICRVTDEGNSRDTYLTAYQRVIVSVVG